MEADVPFFFKQWGANLELVQIGKKELGRLLDGREWNEFPRPDAKTLEMLEAAVEEWKRSVLQQKKARRRRREIVLVSLQQLEAATAAAEADGSAALAAYAQRGEGLSGDVLSA
jgi:hypothetical protein